MNHTTRHPSATSNQQHYMYPNQLSTSNYTFSNSPAPRSAPEMHPNQGFYNYNNDQYASRAPSTRPPSSAPYALSSHSRSTNQNPYTDSWSNEMAMSSGGPYSALSSPLYAGHSARNGQYISSGVSAPMPSRLPQSHKVEPLDMSHLLQQDFGIPWTGSSSGDFPSGVNAQSQWVHPSDYAGFANANQHQTIHPFPYTPTSSSSSPSPGIDPRRRASIDSTGSSVKMCSHCHATSTPLWRREPVTLRPLCNACGLYLQQRNKLRPQELIDADNDDDSSDGSGDGTGPECSHCHTHNTSVWRRSKTGDQLCNACGVYSRLKGKDRPLSLKRNKIKPRSKHTK
ncbi:hypothetical protein C8J56DRAFT_1169280 [Mycena floridula]|nr:hypothetical protein C8J56DRAFT_1169280 [Mycena floridula]